MSYVSGYQCTICSRKYSASVVLMTCPVCGEKGILDVLYDYDRIRDLLTKDYFNGCHDFSIWRYLPLLPVEEKYTKNSLKVGWTPLYHSEVLGKKYQVRNLYIKDDGLNPTQSLKDRASVIACVKAKELGQEVIACASTGNAASSLAGNAARFGIKTVIFVPKRSPIAKLTQILMFGSVLIKVNGDYKDAYSLSKKAIEHFGWYNRNAAINPNLIEGKKTVALEIAEQLNFHLTDWVVVSVGDGCTIGGVYKGFYDLKQIGLIKTIPKVLGVQSEGCQPFVEAFKNKKDLEETEENTIADSIAVGIPRNPIKGLKAVSISGGSYIIVSDQEILSSMSELAKQEGVFAEPAAAASLAGFIKARELEIINENDSVTIIITGNGLKDTVNASKINKEPILLDNNLDDLIHYLKRKEEENE